MLDNFPLQKLNVFGMFYRVSPIHPFIHAHTVPPLYVHMHGLNGPLVAGVRNQVSCVSAGARPTPKINWSKAGVALRGDTAIVSRFTEFPAAGHSDIPVLHDKILIPGLCSSLSSSCRARVPAWPSALDNADNG